MNLIALIVTLALILALAALIVIVTILNFLQILGPFRPVRAYGPTFFGQARPGPARGPARPVYISKLNNQRIEKIENK